ncbi:MAG: hypothetical protein H0V66_06805 [Bdellovibrionales bacterium]|nr:hypothetical protein [Bdellovibrionales bacterium]
MTRLYSLILMSVLLYSCSQLPAKDRSAASIESAHIPNSYNVGFRK